MCAWALHVRTTCLIDRCPYYLQQTQVHWIALCLQDLWTFTDHFLTQCSVWRVRGGITGSTKEVSIANPSAKERLNTCCVVVYCFENFSISLKEAWYEIARSRSATWCSECSCFDLVRVCVVHDKSSSCIASVSKNGLYKNHRSRWNDCYRC